MTDQWQVAYTLDGWGEDQTVRSETAEHAAWQVALDMASRGFEDRIALIGVYPKAPNGAQNGTVSTAKDHR